tara:strand:- start:1163 stop:1342 length:180 start_codon:yes stop_codon:yes gene_type:complete
LKGVSPSKVAVLELSLSVAVQSLFDDLSLAVIVSSPEERTPKDLCQILILKEMAEKDLV